MKKLANRLIQSEKGQALMLTLILLGVGGLIMSPLMAFMGTGLMAGGAFEDEMKEFYAADAGIEYGLWHLTVGDLTVPECGTVPGNGTALAFTLDNRPVTVNITIPNVTGGPTHRITSSAGNTIIEAYVTITEGFFEPFCPANFYQLQGNLTIGWGRRRTGNYHVFGYVCLCSETDLFGYVYAEGDVTLCYRAEIHGSVRSTGNVTLGTRAQIHGHINTDGDVELCSRAVVHCSILADGDVILGTRTQVHGNVYARENVNLGTRAKISGSVYAEGNVWLCYRAKIHGNVFVRGTLCLCWRARIKGTVHIAPDGRVRVNGDWLNHGDQHPAIVGPIIWNSDWGWPSFEDRIEIEVWETTNYVLPPPS